MMGSVKVQPGVVRVLKVVCEQARSRIKVLVLFLPKVM